MSADFSCIKGAEGALNDPNCPVTSIYDLNYSVKTIKTAKSFLGGQALFTEPIGPIKCGGAP